MSSSNLICLVRVSQQTYHLFGANQLDDISLYEASQLHQCLEFDTHVRGNSITIAQFTTIALPLVVPAGYKELARRWNDYHHGPERFSTFERELDGSVRVCIQGLPVTSALLGLDSKWAVPDAPDNGGESRGSASSYTNLGLNVVDTSIIVEEPFHGNDDTLRPLEQHMDRTKKLAQELHNFLLARYVSENLYASLRIHDLISADIEEEYSLRLSRLGQPVGAHIECTPGELRTSVCALLRETSGQSTAHAKLSADIKTNAHDAQTGLIESFDEFRGLMETARRSLSSMIYVMPGDGDTDAVIYTSQDWQQFMRRCYTFQEKSLERIKAALWSYTNHISAACVADDQTCETVRLALEKLEASEEAVKIAYVFSTKGF